MPLYHGRLRRVLDSTGVLFLVLLEVVGGDALRPGCACERAFLVVRLCAVCGLRGHYRVVDTTDGTAFVDAIVVAQRVV